MEHQEKHHEGNEKSYKKQGKRKEDTECQVITELTGDDVLLGRGVGPNEHQGNVRYREIVKAHQPEYLATVNRKLKDKVAHKAIKSVKSNGARFLSRLKKEKARAMGFRRDVYVIAEPNVVLEKTKQALRFKGRKHKEGGSSESKGSKGQPDTVAEKSEKDDATSQRSSLSEDSASESSADEDDSEPDLPPSVPSRNSNDLAHGVRSASSRREESLSSRDINREERAVTSNASRDIHHDHHLLPHYSANAVAASPLGAAGSLRMVGSVQEAQAGLPAVSLRGSENIRQLAATEELLRHQLIEAIVAGSIRSQFRPPPRHHTSDFSQLLQQMLQQEQQQQQQQQRQAAAARAPILENLSAANQLLGGLSHNDILRLVSSQSINYGQDGPLRIDNDFLPPAGIHHQQPSSAVLPDLLRRPPPAPQMQPPPPVANPAMLLHTNNDDIVRSALEMLLGSTNTFQRQQQSFSSNSNSTRNNLPDYDRGGGGSPSQRET